MEVASVQCVIELWRRRLEKPGSGEEVIFAGCWGIVRTRGTLRVAISTNSHLHPPAMGRSSSSQRSQAAAAAAEAAARTDRRLQFAVINEKHDQLPWPPKLTWKFKTINTYAREEGMGLRSQWDFTSANILHISESQCRVQPH